MSFLYSIYCYVLYIFFRPLGWYIINVYKRTFYRSIFTLRLYDLP
jgi:hypothetical protein